VTYDPFAPGPFPVGMRASEATDMSRGARVLPFEVWYPDGDRAKRGGRHPLVVASHSSGGHKRQLAYLCAHLASHGYIVAAPDHTGSTSADAALRAKRAARNDVLSAAEREALIAKMIADRVPDLRFLVATMLGGMGDLSRTVDAARIGLVGWSFGGWSVLATLEADDRVGAVVALAPAGASNPLPGILPVTLTFKWRRDVPTLLLAAEDDRFIPLSGVKQLFERTPSRKRMFVLRGADHGHFADQIADPGACSPEQAHLFTRGLTLAHLDSVLREDRAAQKFLDSEPVAELRARGVSAEAV
jgi:predicted dienelactone hydrolase